MAAVGFQNVSRLSIKRQLNDLLFHSRHSPSPQHQTQSVRCSVRSFCALKWNKVNKHRLLSYHSYIMPKPMHLREGNKASISPSFGCGGEDSFFTTKKNEQLFVGVADGVGSWKPQKAKDAARYSQELMRSAARFTMNGDDHNTSNGEDSNNAPRSMAHFAWHRVSETLQFDGASTLCLVHIGELLEDDGAFQCRLDAFNLGDSGFSVYRHLNDNQMDADYGLIYKSPAQEQGFGIPYQLGSHPTANRVDDGHSVTRLLLKSLDIVVVGSDGLWDNLWDHEMAQIIGDSMASYHRQWNENGNSKGLSFGNFVHRQIVGGGLTHKIMKEAYLSSIDRKKSTPWSVSMTDTVDMVYDGGKPDDITCVVVFIH